MIIKIYINKSGKVSDLQNQKIIKHSRYRMCSTAVPQDNYGMKQAIALYIFSTMRRKRK